MNETDKLIEEQVKTLPQNLKQAIDGVPWKALVQEIGKANALDAEQITSLEQETMFIIYAFESPEDYTGNLVREIGISEDVASTIAESVADKIFDPILQKNDELEKAKQTKTEPAVPTSIPEIPPVNLPMVEKGETAHDVAPATSEVRSKEDEVSNGKQEQPKEKVSLPDYRYPDGKDPYREPLG